MNWTVRWESKRSGDRWTDVLASIPAQALEATDDEWHFAPGFFQPGGAFGQDFFSSIFLGGVAEAGSGEGGFLVYHEIVHEARNRSAAEIAGLISFPDFQQPACADLAVTLLARDFLCQQNVIIIEAGGLRFAPARGICF